MKRIAIIAAMPGELKPFVEGCQHERRGGFEIWTRRAGDRELVATYGGAGQQAATRAFAAIERGGALDAAISIGWVGALAEEFAPGRAFRIVGVIDQQTGERFITSEQNTGEEERTVPQGLKPDSSSKAICGTAKAVLFQNKAFHGKNENIWLVTSPRVADEAAKQRLATTYGAQLVDMEAAAIARLAAMRGIRFYAVKGVSDGFRDHLPDFNRFIGPRGQFHVGKLVLFVLPRPWLWPALVRMGENSKKASEAIAAELEQLLAGSI